MLNIQAKHYGTIENDTPKAYENDYIIDIAENGKALKDHLRNNKAIALKDVQEFLHIVAIAAGVTKNEMILDRAFEWTISSKVWGEYTRSGFTKMKLALKNFDINVKEPGKNDIYTQ